MMAQNGRKLFNVLNQYSYSEDKAKSTRLKKVMIVKSKNRLATQKEIEKKLSDVGLLFMREKTRFSSQPATIIDYSELTKVKGSQVILVFKSQSGGMQETTLNSTITELVPALAFMNNFSTTKVEELYDFLKNLDHSKQTVYLNDRDEKAGIEFIDAMPTSSKFEIKMKNAMGVQKYLIDEHKKRPIKEVFWGYRAKPKYKNKQVSSKHKGDIFLLYEDGNMLGVSLKAGEEKSAEPKLNTYVNKIFETLDPNKVEVLRNELYNKIYKSFSTDKSQYDIGAERRNTKKKLSDFESRNLKKYEELYDKGLNIIRKTLVDVLTENVKKTVAYFNEAIVGKDENVPLILVKAFNDTYKIDTSDDDVEVFLPRTKKIESKISKTSKQNFTIELIENTRSKMGLEFAVRSNKVGDDHKLGQFFNLAVKFNGVSK